MTLKKSLHMNHSTGNFCVGGDVKNSNTVNKNYYIEEKKEKRDFGIIEEIFNFLLGSKGDALINPRSYRQSASGKGLKKIPLNFSGASIQTINELAIKTNLKRSLVERFVSNQLELDEGRVNALIIKLQKDFRKLKGTTDNYKKIEDIKVIEKMAKNCLDITKQDNPDYYMNALSIVLYFFELCDFGDSEETKPTQEVVF